ncbi:19555_t:CDS:2, partial [Gigaspora rosea]
EPFDDTVFDSNKEQENAFEVLLKEITTECDTLVQKLASGEKEPTQEPGGKINADKNEEKNNTEIVEYLKEQPHEIAEVKNVDDKALDKNNHKTLIVNKDENNEDKEMESLLTYPNSRSFETDKEEAWKTEEDEKVKIKRKGRISISSNIAHEYGRVDDDNGKADKRKTYYGTANMDNDETVKDDNYISNDKTAVEENGDIADDIEKGLAKKKRNRACKLWLEKVNNGQKEKSRYLNDRGVEIDDDKSEKSRDEDGTMEKLIGTNRESTEGLVGICS